MTDFSLTGVAGPNYSFWSYCTITNPSTGPVPGASVTIQVTATDDKYGIAGVHFYWRGRISPALPASYGAWQYLGYDDSSPYSMLWTFPSCGTYPYDQFQIRAWAQSNNGRIVWGHPAGVDVLLTGRGC